MTLFLNFITALAWLWGGLMAVKLLMNLVDGIRFAVGTKAYDESTAAAAKAIRSGVLPWAWLIARYWL